MKNKRPKRIIALKMQTKEERTMIGFPGSPFLSKNWLQRTRAIKARLEKKRTRV